MTPARFEHRCQDRASATTDESLSCSDYPLGIASQWGVVILGFTTELRRNPPWAKVRSCASTKTDAFACWARPAGGVFSFHFWKRSLSKSCRVCMPVNDLSQQRTPGYLYFSDIHA